MSRLTEQHCQPGIRALRDDQKRKLLSLLPNWQMGSDGDSIEREFRFRNYYETIAFVNALAWIAHRENHHPDLEVHYNRCVVHYSTHSAGGVSENDFICAAKIDAMLDSHTTG